MVLNKGEYDHATLECRLSTQDRRTQNHHFIVAANSVDYFENQCTQSLDINNFTNSNSSQFYSNREMNNNLIGSDGSISSYNCGFRYATFLLSSFYLIYKIYL